MDDSGNTLPGQKGLVICLALVAAFFGTPILFDQVGPWVEAMTLRHYGDQDLATLAYGASFLLTGATIFFAAQVGIAVALGAAGTFGALRLAGI